MIEPEFHSDEGRALFRRLADPDAFPDIDPDEEIWPMKWTDTLFEAFRPAQL